LDTFIFQIHSYLYAQAGVCGIISQREYYDPTSILNRFPYFAKYLMYMKVRNIVTS